MKSWLHGTAEEAVKNRGTSVLLHSLYPVQAYSCLKNGSEFGRIKTSPLKLNSCFIPSVVLYLTARLFSHWKKGLLHWIGMHGELICEDSLM